MSAASRSQDDSNQSKSKELALAGQVCSAVVCFLGWPCFLVLWVGLPIIGWAQVMFQGKDSGGCNGKVLFIRHQEIGAGEFALGFLEHVAVLWDAIHIRVVANLFGWQVEEVPLRSLLRWRPSQLVSR